MRAAVFDRPGEPAEVLRLEDRPAPEPGRGEVRVRMLLCPVNPSDLLFVRGQYTVSPVPPATPGFEGVGVVEAAGGPLARLLVGRRVCVLASGGGTWAEQTVAKARQCVPVPSHLSDEQAAGFFVNPATALALTRHVLRVPPGEWLLQTAAGSQVGRMVIRLGKRDGFRTLNVVRRREQADELLALGADAVLVEGHGSLAEQVRQHAPGGVRFALDAVGGATGTQAVEALAPGGRLVVYGALSGEPLAVSPRSLISAGCRVDGFWLGHWAKSRGVLNNLRLTRIIGRLVADGTLVTHVGEVFPLSVLADAVRAAERPGKAGKVLLKIGERSR